MHMRNGLLMQYSPLLPGVNWQTHACAKNFLIFVRCILDCGSDYSPQIRCVLVIYEIGIVLGSTGIHFKVDMTTGFAEIVTLRAW